MLCGDQTTFLEPESLPAMRPDDTNLGTLFSQQIVQYAVPHYQRPQAWAAKEHWTPLWADIEGKANEWYEGREPRRHYLGAIVLAKRPKPGSRGIDRILVIDGQQRLSTMQYVLKALLLIAEEAKHEDARIAIRSELFNPVMESMTHPDTQRIKLWPTFRDRDAHMKVMNAASVTDLWKLFPGDFTQIGTLYVNRPHPRPLECTLFFYETMKDWLKDLTETFDLHHGIEAIRRAIVNSLQLIALWLESGDDPQVIFECLNGRGAPLRPTDLIKNYIFMSAEGEPGGEELAEEGPLFKLWSKLDGDEWMSILPRGRLKQTRLEWLLYYSLQAETGKELDTTSLYTAYREWAPPSVTPVSVAASASVGPTALQQVQILVEHAAALTAFVGEDFAKPIGRLGVITEALGVTTVSPLALAIARNCSPEVQGELFGVLSSYLVRREVLGLGTKAYNHVFMTALRALRQHGFTPEVLAKHLGGLGGVSHEWPTDADFTAFLVSRPVYGPGSAICRILLASAANSIGANASAEVNWSPDWKMLHLEHLMPRSWYEHWPLSDGSVAAEADTFDAALAAPDHPRKDWYELVRSRESSINTLGNLTILNSSLNIALQNLHWSHKREHIGKNTQLQMNFALSKREVWDEAAIRERSVALAGILCANFVAPPPRAAA